MRTPAGKECRFYYEDFYRGRDIQECRLANANPNSQRWDFKDCNRCQVPDILNANSSKDMQLTLTIRSTMLGFVRRLEVEAYCTKHRVKIDDPFVGCPECNKERPGLDIFRQALENLDSQDD